MTPVEKHLARINRFKLEMWLIDRYKCAYRRQGMYNCILNDLGREVKAFGNMAKYLQADIRIKEQALKDEEETKELNRIQAHNSSKAVTISIVALITAGTMPILWDIIKMVLNKFFKLPF